MAGDSCGRTFKFQTLQELAKFVLTGDNLNTEEQLVLKLCLAFQQMCVYVCVHVHHLKPVCALVQ